MPVPWDLCDPTDRAIGLDVSHWQPSHPWDGVLELGVRWAVVKAWHGRGPCDAAVEQLASANAAGLLVGRYAWLLPDSNLDLQLGAWCASPILDALPLTIDFEEPTTPLRGRKLLELLERAILVVEDRTGRAPIVYTGAWYWSGYCSDLDSQIVARCPLWLAAYPRKGSTGTRYREAVAEVCGGIPPAVPRPWADRGLQPTIWQFDGDHGLVLPSGADVDVDVASWSRLLELSGPGRSPTEPAPAPSHADEPMGGATPAAPASPLRADEAEHTPITLRSSELVSGFREDT